MKTVLLTGASGFIGAHLAKKFLDNNCMVIAPVRQAITQGVSLQCWHLIEIEIGLFVSTLARLTGFGFSFRYAFTRSLDLECSTVQ